MSIDIQHHALAHLTLLSEPQPPALVQSVARNPGTSPWMAAAAPVVLSIGSAVASAQVWPRMFSSDGRENWAAANAIGAVTDTLAFGSGHFLAGDVPRSIGMALGGMAVRQLAWAGLMSSISHNWTGGSTKQPWDDAVMVGSLGLLGLVYIGIPVDAWQTAAAAR
ncbi:MAG: hypothetical protein VKO64_03145 [Candidatus Sericytochromatia bacterium]|nr:hypothetical protein [Candidatus Sericytochromatia bacterium]